MNLSTKITVNPSIKRIIKITAITVSVCLFVIFLLYLLLLVTVGYKLGAGLREMEGRSGNPIPHSDRVCKQVITPARNVKTGEVKDFPTPCDVPTGWKGIK